MQKYYVSKEGLHHFFGPLEARVMDILWSSEGLSIKEVQGVLNEGNPLSFNTIMTIMNRLVEKGHLRKDAAGKRGGRTSYYEPVQSKEQFLLEQTQALTYGLIKEYGPMVIDQMIDALDNASPEVIAKLEAKINTMKNRLEKLF